MPAVAIGQRTHQRPLPIGQSEFEFPVPVTLGPGTNRTATRHPEPNYAARVLLGNVYTIWKKNEKKSEPNSFAGDKLNKTSLSR